MVRARVVGPHAYPDVLGAILFTCTLPLPLPPAPSSQGPPAPIVWVPRRHPLHMHPPPLPPLLPCPPARVYWNTKKQQVPLEDDLFGVSDEEAGGHELGGGGGKDGEANGGGGSLPVSPRTAAAATRQQALGGGSGGSGAGGGAAELAGVVALGALDLSLLDAPPSQSLLALKLVGSAGWAPRLDPGPGDKPRQVVSLAEYRRLRGLA